MATFERGVQVVKQFGSDELAAAREIIAANKEMESFIVIFAGC